MDYHLDRDIFTQFPQIMGKSHKIVKIFKELKRIAPKDLPVLISSENGTYKELVAKTIHYNSPRRNGPFIAINLSSIPKELAETEMFGYGKSRSRVDSEKTISKINEANRGTLFLEEISEMDTNLQEKLFNFMQDKKLRSPDQKTFVQSDVRIIGTTCKNLKEIVKKGHFSENLYNVFNAVHIKIPSLRERKEDILPLSKYFLKEAVDKFETGPKELSKEAMAYLIKYDWPYNMRELKNTMKKAAIFSNGPIIEKKDLFIEDIGSCSISEFLEEKLKRYLKEMTKLENCNLYETVLSEVERSLIKIVLKETEGNQLKASRTLGINRNTLRTKIKEYKIRI